MVANIRYLRRASGVFKFLAFLSLLPTLATLALTVLGAFSRPSALLTSLMVVVPLLISMAVVFFGLFTIGVVLDYLTQLGEEILIIRRVQWEQTSVTKKS